MSSDWLAVIFVFGTFSVAILVILIFIQLAETNSKSRKLGRLIKKKFNKVSKRNTLYGCESCARYYRLYQLDLLKKDDDIYRCPHCNYKAERGLNSKVLVGEVKKPDKWMDSHSDCFRVSLKQYFMIQNTAMKVKKLREEEKAIQRFEEYSKLSTDMSWIEKIQKVKD